MTRLHSRLLRLEKQLADGSGFRPHSPEWLDYWGGKLTRILTGEEASEAGCIPLEVWDAFAVEPGERNGPNTGSNPLELAPRSSAGAATGRSETATDNA